MRLLRFTAGNCLNVHL